MSNPRCCGAEARWVNNGPNLQYWFCGECKNEVSLNPSLGLKDVIPQAEVDAAVADALRHDSPFHRLLFLDDDGNPLSYTVQEYGGSE